MGAVNGTLLVVQISDATLVCETDSSFDLTADMIETTCKGSGNWKTFIPGEKSGTLPVEAVYDETGTYSYSEAFADLDAGTELTWKWGQTGAGTKYYTGSGLWSDLSAQGPQNDRATWGGTIQITGTVTEAVNPT